MATITLGDLRIEVVRKNIKHLHLSIHPPAGTVRISAPLFMSRETIRSFAASQLGWIARHREKLNARKREPPKEYRDGETHSYLGKRYVMKHKAHEPARGVRLLADVMEVRMRGEPDCGKAKTVLRSWYRDNLRSVAAGMIKKWEPILGVTVRELGIKSMKTRWGTCNPRARRIWLNLELVKRRKECIEYVVAHEMAHLLVRNHGPAFKKLMDAHVPKWKILRRELNAAPPLP